MEKSIKVVENEKYELIPTDGWNSLLNSGDIALFKGKATKLSETYSEIGWYNNELKNLRFAIERESNRPEILRNYTRDRTNVSEAS